jgi:hypothetical protein
LVSGEEVFNINAMRKFLYFIMANYCENGQSVFLTQQEFLKELTSDQETDNELLQKRQPLQGKEDLSHKPIKAKPAGSASRPKHQPDVSNETASGPESALDGSRQTTSDSSHRFESNSTDEPSLTQQKLLLPNQLDCQKQLLKQFLFETLFNEKINVQRFKLLPENCQTLIAIFLKESLNFDICKETNSGSTHKYLYRLSNNWTCSEPRSPEKAASASLSFLTRCYLYGLGKQTKRPHSERDLPTLAKLIYDALLSSEDQSLQGPVPVAFEEFFSDIEDLVLERCEKVSQLCAHHLYVKLFSKMKQISQETLQRFYAVSTKKYLDDLVDSSPSMRDLSERFINLRSRLGLFSSYVDSQSSQSRRYILTCLDRYSAVKSSRHPN